jgi:hypothetical protein
VGPTLSAPKPAHRLRIIRDDLVRFLVLGLASMNLIKGNQTDRACGCCVGNLK